MPPRKLKPPAITGEFSRMIDAGSHALTDKLVRQAAESRVATKEAFIRAYLKDMGLTIDQVELVEIHDGQSIRWHLQQRGKP